MEREKERGRRSAPSVRATRAPPSGVSSKATLPRWSSAASVRNTASRSLELMPTTSIASSICSVCVLCYMCVCVCVCVFVRSMSVSVSDCICVFRISNCGHLRDLSLRGYDVCKCVRVCVCLCKHAHAASDQHSTHARMRCRSSPAQCNTPEDTFGRKQSIQSHVPILARNRKLTYHAACSLPISLHPSISQILMHTPPQ